MMNQLSVLVTMSQLNAHLTMSHLSARLTFPETFGAFKKTHRTCGTPLRCTTTMNHLNAQKGLGVPIQPVQSNDHITNL